MHRVERAVLVGFLAISFVARAAQSECATEPPPEGLVERCHQLVITPVPESRTALEFSLHNWMESCAIDERAGELVFGNDSVDYVWQLIEGRPMWKGGVTILPDYTPVSWQEAGKTCYGIGSVRFHVKGADSEVEEGDPVITVNPAPASDEIISAATAADAALADPSTTGSEQVSRMRSVLHAMKTYGADFDDTYYTVAPILGGGPTCYQDATGNRCSPDDEAVSNCEAHLAKELVREARGGADGAALGRMLEGRADQIDRGLKHMWLIQGQDSPGAVPCPNLPEAIWPQISRRSGDPKSLYYWWTKGP